MILTCWILVALASCFSQALSPLVSVVLEPSNSNGSPEDQLALPQKRLHQNRNFLRFGRSDVDLNRNFLRFGRGSNEKYYDETEPTSVANNIPHFLREVRNRNFLRFGRSGESQLGLEDRQNPFEVPLDLQENGEVVQKDEVDDNMIRSARGNRNFLRFGRQYNKNFLRFGRSSDRGILASTT